MVYALLELTAQGSSEGVGGLPLNICLVLDQSLSMQGEKMEQARDAARYVADQLGPRDAISVVSFNDRATIVVRAQRNAQPREVRSAVEGIIPKGGTELAAGLKAGLDELRRGVNLTGRAVSSLLVLTDGRTYGDESRCLELAEHARKLELLITPLGVGEEWNEDLLETIAYRCGSHSQYIDRPDAIVRAFREHIESLRNICGRQAQVTIRTAADTRLTQAHRVYPLIGRVELVSSGNVSEQTYLLDNLRLGETQGLLLELVLPPVVDGVVDVAGCILEWKPIDSHDSRVQARYSMRAEVDPHATPTGTLDATVRLAVEKVMAYKLQKRAWQDVAEGNLAAATSKLRMVVTRLLEAGEPDLARTVQSEADNLERNGVMSATGTKQIKYGTRGLGRTRSMRVADQVPS
ncbi:MAG TPA: VWA domain-containing protein [Chloroflexia bacterium]|nr:VWA domain-containing protein [Chloroflexia bacterium]